MRNSRSITKLIARARHYGGHLRVRNGLLEVGVASTQSKAQIKLIAKLRRELLTNTYAVKACLYEEAADLAYQRSGQRRDWWKDYDSGRDIRLDVVPERLERVAMPEPANVTSLSPDAYAAQIKQYLADHKAAGGQRRPRPRRLKPVKLILDPRTGKPPISYDRIPWPADFARVQEAHRQRCLDAGGRIIGNASEDAAYIARMRKLFRRRRAGKNL